jgi:hypothetical protein
MIDFIFAAGQALSAMGLAYGAYLVLTYRSYFDGTRERTTAPCGHQMAAA